MATELSANSKLLLETMVGFIGGGKMAQAMAKGFISSGLVRARNILVSDKHQYQLDVAKELGCQTTHNNKDVASNSDLVFLSVKPKCIAGVLEDIRPVVHPNKQLVVSIAAGITLESIEKNLPEGTRVVRVMPNTASLVQAGAAVCSTGTHASTADEELVKELLRTIGTCEAGPESFLDAVTGLSGSGPAYAYLAIESLADGGVKMGLPRDLALKLATQTLLGSAKMVHETGRHPGVLKDDVCSPGGTTIAALHSLEKNGFRGCLMDAVETATLKARELGATAAASQK